MADNDDAFVYYRALRLANVKAFIPGTTLDLCVNGRPAPWTLILGENGLGKTTLLQCLALLRPTLNVQQSPDGKAWFITDTAAIAAGFETKATVLESKIVMPFVRAQLVNGATLQTEVEFDTALVSI